MAKPTTSAAVSDREIVMEVAGAVAVVAVINHAAIVAEVAVDSVAIAEAAEAAAAEVVDLLEAVSAALHLDLTINCLTMMIEILTK
jgi:hypothetical protein